ncbi:EpsG family protein [Porphyromonas loveana]|uniref:EpsG family protein n=2 Tax=Porphyromonas loveana TaxID=1884669 RepID=UPI00359FDF55
MYLVIIFLSIVFFALADVSKKLRNPELITILFFLLFFTLSAIRWDRGTDWDYYYLYFRDGLPKEFSWDYVVGDKADSSFEMPYRLLFMTGKAFLKDYTTLLFVQAAIIFPLFYRFLRRYSESRLLSLAVWFAINFCFIFFVRQAIAMAIALQATDFLIKRKPLPFVLVILLAACIHMSAVVFLLAYFFSDRKYSYKTLLTTFVLAWFVGQFVLPHLLDGLATSGIGRLSEKAQAYIELGTTSFGSSISHERALFNGIVYRIAFIIIAFTVFKDLLEEDKLFRLAVNMMFMGLILFVMLTPLSEGIGRAASYFDIFQIIALPTMVVKSQRLKEKVGMTLILLLFLTMRLESTIMGYAELYIPYKSIL